MKNNNFIIISGHFEEEKEHFIIYVKFTNEVKSIIKFPKNYPFNPLIISCVSGLNNLFDRENNLILDYLYKE